MSLADQRAWGDFWRGEAGREGCLPHALQRIDAAQQACWAEFAPMLPQGARVLDLATGNGVVLRRLAAARPDLKLTGVDSAAGLPPAPRGIVLKAGVAMERLPFPDAGFAAVTSQFGIEYGDVPEIAREIARVLRPGGRLRAAIHHSDSPILAHNRSRRDALVWAAGTSRYLDRARSLAAARRLSPLPTPDSFREAPAEARARFPDQAVAEEFVTALLQTLEMGRQAPWQETMEVLARLEERAANELARIDSLERAVRDEEGIAGIAAELRAAGVETAPPALLREAGPVPPFAWLLDGRRG